LPINKTKLNSENLTIVVDGGASGCRLAAFDTAGLQCASTHDGPASLSVGEQQAWQHISRGLTSLAAQIGEPDDWLPKRLWMGLAGTLQSSRSEHFLSLIPDTIDPVVITDGHAQLLGAAAGRPGVCLSMGTGSVIHWLDMNGNVGKAGGWGYPVGDEGSGAWLGMQLINRYLWFVDSNAEAGTSIMFSALAQRIGTDVSDIQLWTTCKSSTEIASLAPIVVKAAHQGDELANTIVNNGTHYCEQLIDLAPDNVPLYIVGGLADLYTAHLQNKYRNRWQAAAGSALEGLYIFANQYRGPQR